MPSSEVSLSTPRSRIGGQGGPSRAFDLCVVLLLAPAALIFGGLIAVAVWIDSPGGVFHRGTRVGHRGKRFRMLKFRTMVRETGGDTLRVKGDLRHTPLGRALSASHLDELPQLWNVLRGEMSLVGPRPDLPEFVDERREAFAVSLSVRPGITGPAQLEHCDDGEILLRVPATMRREYYLNHLLPEKLAANDEYVQHRSAAGDLRVLALTLVVLFAGARPRRAGRRHRWALAHRSVGYASTLALTALYALQVGVA